MALKSGFKAAYLSPTEVLAAQNYAILQRYFPEYAVGYLAGRNDREGKAGNEVEAEKRGDRRRLRHARHAARGRGDPRSRFYRLRRTASFRRGAEERSRGKGGGRGYAGHERDAYPEDPFSDLYGDLDITTITDKPKARQEVATSIISEGRYDDMLDYIGREVRAGKQAYFVCSKIDEDDEEGTLISVKELYEELKARLPFVRFALLHGKMKDREKAEIMRAFKEKQYDCLVSTTVIEVGVDVPNATIMVIYNAERFGLRSFINCADGWAEGAKRATVSC